MTLRQRQPRIEEPAYLAFVRTLPCLVCGRPGPSDPAHIRAAAPQYGKRYTGKGEKPDDKWTLPLCRRDHDAQHRESELGWWAGMGIADPFAVAVALYASWPGSSRPRVERQRKPRAVKPRLPKSQRKPILGRTSIPAHKTEWASPPLRSRNSLKQNQRKRVGYFEETK